MPLERINAVEANLLSMVRIVDDLQKEINALKVIVTQHSVGLGEQSSIINELETRTHDLEALIIP